MRLYQRLYQEIGNDDTLWRGVGGGVYGLWHIMDFAAYNTVNMGDLIYF